MPAFIEPSAAVRAIQKRREVRVYQETPVLKLLGLEDKYIARMDWQARRNRPTLDVEKATLDNVRNELAKRTKSELSQGREDFLKRNKVWTYFPDEGPLRRELYPKHMETIGYTLTDEEILMMAANKVGKTQLGALCVAHWTMGRYPSWWNGREFDGPITAWVCNVTAKDCRDINEAELLGPPGNDAERGTGMVPGHLIGKCTPKPGTQHSFEFIQVEHVSGGWSTIVTKSYEMGREAFQGRNIPVIWNDEEVPEDVAAEQKLRIMTINGLILYTYTPIEGLTEFTQQFMQDAGLSIEAMRDGTAVRAD